MPFRWLHAGRWSRLVIVVAGTAAALLVFDQSARAQQRDPFDPLVSPGATATDDTGVTSTSAEGGGGNTTDTAPAPSVEESSLPNTGYGVTQWLAVAYVLVAFGASLILLTKTLQRDE